MKFIIINIKKEIIIIITNTLQNYKLKSKIKYNCKETIFFFNLLLFNIIIII